MQTRSKGLAVSSRRNQRTDWTEESNNKYYILAVPTVMSVWHQATLLMTHGSTADEDVFCIPSSAVGCCVVSVVQLYV